MDARDFAVSETLPNGTLLTIRATRPADRERIAKAFAQPERESVYTRFFGYKKELSEAELARLDAMDFVRDVMLVATNRSSAGEIVIGSARYVAHDDIDGKLVAEVAFTVEEDYQRLGIAGRLLGHMIAIARDCGIARFVAEVLPENKTMLSVFARTDLPLRQRRDAGVVHVEMDLSRDRA